MKISWISLFACLAVLLAVCASGCSTTETVLAGEERAEVLAYAEPITDNLLQGFNEDNYSMYSRDFSSQMREELDEAAFRESREFIVSRIGLYLERDDPVVTRNGEYVAVNYRADFEHEQGVAVRVVFLEDDESHQIQGLWFDSPKLRG
ncbi:MAG: DUF3887 domain-containing protein [Methanomicrobiaceae archaeon]|nr:DUF3887 domain-containing protein [Methanomicrobiaceae archaeon]MDD5418771.1 DUF3887 domain-containing protein [Methanomicrobiaceae archaeon]